MGQVADESAGDLGELRVGDRFLSFLSAASENIDERLSDLPLLSSREWEALVVWNRTTTVYPADKCVPDLFREQVVRAPDATALVSDFGFVSYAGLDARSDRIAAGLRALAGGICLFLPYHADKPN